MNHPRNHAETQVHRLSFEVRQSSKTALFVENDDFRSFWREKERKQRETYVVKLFFLIKVWMDIVKL